MKTTLRNALFCIATLGIVSGLFAREAAAARVAWEILPDRERAVITLNNEEGFAGQVRRVDPFGLIMELSLPPYEAGSVPAPENAAIFRIAEPRGQALAFFTRTDAFGFVSTRPDRNTVVVDVFPDPMGKRWRPTPGAVTQLTAAGPSMEPPAETAGSGTSAPVNAVPAQQPAPSAPADVAAPTPDAVGAGYAGQSPDSIPVRETLQTTQVAGSSLPETDSAAEAHDAMPAPTESVSSASDTTAGAAATDPGAGNSGSGDTASEPVRLRPPDPVLPMVAPQNNAASAPDSGLADPASVALAASPADSIGVPAPETAPVSSSVTPVPAAAMPQQPRRPDQRNPVTAVRGRVAFENEEPEPIVPQEYAGVPVRPLGGSAGAGLAEEAAPHIFRSRFNPGSLTDWYEMQRGTAQQGAVVNLPSRQGSAAPPQEAAQQDQSGGHGEVASDPSTATLPDGTQVTYTDAQGKPVPAPVDPNVLQAEMNQLIGEGAFAQALEKAEELLVHPFLPSEQRGDVLHAKAELLFAIHKDDLLAYFETIVAATEEALNHDRASPRNAAALLRMGYMHLQMNNTAEATAYFNMLRTRYPLDENIPLTYYYWGDYYYGRGEMLRAADQFQYVVQHFAESPYARDASIGLARSYMALGYDPQAFQVVEYIESRWPRFYLESPSVLEMMGDAAYKLDNLDYALNKYWTYYNINPDGSNTDVVLTRIGDIYSARKQREAARSVYQEALRRFPGKDGGLVAMMRLAEDGVNDAPSLTEMLMVFDGPYNLAPAETYRKIIDEHPGSDLVPLARLKLAMWLLWNRQYEEAIQVCSDLRTQSPNSELAPRAEEVALQAFAVMSAEAVAQGRSSQVQAVWDKYPVVHSQAGALEPESRVALGVSLWQEGDPDRALAVIEPFFLGNKIPEYSEMALTLALNIFLEHDQWERIQELHGRVDLWNLTPETRRQMEYALALAHENLGQEDRAVPLWNTLYRDGGLNEGQMAYAEFFLSRDAEKRRDLRSAYTYGFSALNRFMDQARINPAQEDSGRINTLLSSLMDITEDAGRFDESLDYASRYLDRLPADDSLRQGIQFRMSQIYKKQGNDPEWRRLLTDLAERYPDSFYGRTATSQLRGARLAEEAAQFSPTGAL